ncbi:hypothetical protein ACFSRY_12125 [Pontibacter locisalis]|uniref:Uncharacterized protein n=1 Tax=Pontibacter locisalis TaxID=1719035 RepID=A0ABW5IMV9_9BACT
MKACFTLLLLLVAGSNIIANAQVLPEHPNAKPAPIQKDLHVVKPYVTINAQETAMGAFIVEPDQIASVEVIKEQDAVKQFGDKAREGAVIIRLRESVSLVRVQEVYDFFQVSPDHQQLKLTINDQLVSDKEKLLADLQQIEKLELKKQDVTAVKRNSFDEEAPYLNIVTVKQ